MQTGVRLADLCPDNQPSRAFLSRINANNDTVGDFHYYWTDSCYSQFYCTDAAHVDHLCNKLRFYLLSLVQMMCSRPVYSIGIICTRDSFDGTARSVRPSLQTEK